MKDELNFSYNGGGDAYILQSVAIHFKHTVAKKKGPCARNNRQRTLNVPGRKWKHIMNATIE